MNNRPVNRLYNVPAVENLIDEINSSAKDQELAALFSNCFPNTLDTTVYYTCENNQDDTFIITGDIEAMWLRDSTAQVWPYLELLPNFELEKLFSGLIRRQAYCILQDPYANAFNKISRGSEWETDHTEMKPILHERKWELDSLCYHVRLVYHFWQKTRNASLFDDNWLLTAKLILKTLRNEQRFDREDYYRFQRNTPIATDTLADHGLGNRVKPNGLIASSFRPSDDATILPFLIPANFFAMVSLRQMAEIFQQVYLDTELSAECNKFARQIEDAIYKHAVIKHNEFGEIFAYEVDGFGSHICMDDANVPSLLSLSYLGAIEYDNPIYQNTRRFILSPSNPWYFSGNSLNGIGSIHTGRNRVWPIAIVMQALTSKDEAEIKCCLEQLKRSHGGTYFMHESIDCNNVNDYTRSWFAWANTIFGELLLKVWKNTGF